VRFHLGQERRTTMPSSLSGRCKVGLKTIRDRRYRQLGGVIDHVLETIQMAHQLGLWVEVGYW
jgi:hypothetical protein